MLRGGEGLQEEKHGGEAGPERNTKYDAVNSVSQPLFIIDTQDTFTPAANMLL